MKEVETIILVTLLVGIVIAGLRILLNDWLLVITTILCASILLLAVGLFIYLTIPGFDTIEVERLLIGDAIILVICIILGVAISDSGGYYDDF